MQVTLTYSYRVLRRETVEVPAENPMAAERQAVADLKARLHGADDLDISDIEVTE